jgi:DNA-binding winged helix-turn-helix (wHTH) protein
MPAAASETQLLFYQGEYKMLLDMTVDAAEWEKKDDDLSFVIGALCFNGRMEEAQLLASISLGRKNLSASVRTRFFLGIGYTRLSQYDRALGYFIENLICGRTHKVKAADRFFIFQGISFYRFFCGRFTAAKRASDIAFAAAFAADDLYGKALATDVRSHILIGLGETSKGFQLRRQATRFAKHLGNKSLLIAFRISTMIDRARLGFAPKESLHELTQAMASLKPEDNYSRGNFLLELARQLTLRGQVSRAGQILDQASDLIYAHQNRRQEAVLNLRYAELSYCSGDYSRGLSSIRSAKRTLHPEVDRVLEREALGLELKLLRALKMDPHAEKIFATLSERTGRECNFLHRRIMDRTMGTENFGAVRRGMDPLGDLLDLVKMDPDQAIDSVLEMGYFEIFYTVLKLDRQRPTLYLDLRAGLILSFDRGDVTCTDGLTKLLRKVLVSLSQGALSKEELFVRVWGFTYDSLRHDSVIYAAINSIRKLLGVKAHWLETVENGYRLNLAVHVQFHNASEAAVFPEKPETPRSLFSNDFNFRQREIIKHLAKKEYIDVQQCKKLFAISDITASRDLSALTAAGHVNRIGKGRATKYSLSPATK